LVADIGSEVGRVCPTRADYRGSVRMEAAMTIKIIIVSIIALLFFMALWDFTSTTEATATCQQTHSNDVCERSIQP